jgi:hypothetical protein
VDEVEICGASPGTAEGNFYLVRDPATGRWRGPAPTPAQKAWREQIIRGSLLELWLAQGGDEAEFTASWPARWEELQRPTGRLSSSLFAVVDTGLLSDHPLINGHVEQEADFTGEGLEDRNGHGTAVAISIVSRDIPRYANIKVIKANGRGSPDALLAGLRWLLEYQRGHPDDSLNINLSIGLRRARSGRLCNGDCDVCNLTIALDRTGAFISAAAGNCAGETTCPGTVGLLGLASIFTTERLDEETSGKGNVYLPTAGHFEVLDE